MISSADRLRLAARLMREQHGPEHERHEMWEAVASLLDHAASRAESKVAHGGNDRAVWSNERDPLAVADAYLGSAS